MTNMRTAVFKHNAEMWLHEVQFKDWRFSIKLDDTRPYLQIIATDTDHWNGESHDWSSRKWFLSPHMTKSEVVATAFKAVITAMEHEVREQSLFRGVSIYSPHYDVDRLALLRRREDSQDVRTAV